MRYTGARRRSQLVSFISRICIIGLVVSVSLLVVILSVMNGFDKEFRERMLAIIPHVTVQHRQGIEDWRALREVMAQVPNVVDSAPFIEVGGMMFVDRRNVQQALVYGVDPALEAKVSDFEVFLQSGSLLDLISNEGNREDGSRGIFLGKGLAENLAVEQGSQVKIVVPGIGVEGFTVLGIFATGTEVDNSFGLTSIASAYALSPWHASPQNNRVSGLRLKLDDVFLADSISNYIYTRVLPPNQGYYTANWTFTHRHLYYAIRQSKELVGLLLVLIIGIAAFNLVSTLIMVVVDKQGDIAILRTLGASTKKIMGVFMVQGCFIGVIGTSLGLLIGIPLAYGIEDIVQFLENLFGFQLLKSDSYPISFVPTDPLFADIFYIAVTALILSLIATIYPAWRASRVKPAEALRFEV
jgi:lipoprotein-releasing system permease protein